MLGNSAFAATDSAKGDPAEEGESLALMALVKKFAPIPNWIDGSDRFWVKHETSEGIRFLVIDAVIGAGVLYCPMEMGSDPVFRIHVTI